MKTYLIEARYDEQTNLRRRYRTRVQRPMHLAKLAAKELVAIHDLEPEPGKSQVSIFVTVFEVLENEAMSFVASEHIDV